MNPVFPPSIYVPVVIGFFGLATGYLVYGGSELFNSPVSSPESDKSIAIWSLWMSGFMQFFAGILIFVGLTWFPVFSASPALYMAGLAFTAFGVHWFAQGYQKYKGLDRVPNAWMAIAFFFLSLLGIIVFIGAGDVPVSFVFIGLALVYLTEIPTALGVFPAGIRLTGLWRILTAIWLLYLTYGVVLDTVFKAKWWV